MTTAIETQSVFPFGRHKGKPLSEVPRQALCYAATWPDLFPHLREPILQELVRRGLPFGAYKSVPLDKLHPNYVSWLRTIELLPPYDELISRLGEATT